VSVSWVNGGCSGEVFMVECSQRVAGSQPIHRFVVASKVHDYFDDLRLLQFHGVTMPSRITAGLCFFPLLNNCTFFYIWYPFQISKRTQP